MLTCVLAQDLIIEHYQGKSQITLLLPYANFIFSPELDYIDYQLSLQIRNAKGATVFNEERLLKIPKREWLKEAAIPVFIAEDLDYGKHRFSISLRNKKLGDKQSFSYEFNVGTQDTEIGQCFVLAYREGFEYVPESLGISEIDSLKLHQSFGLPLKWISLLIDGERKVFPNPQSPFSVELTELVEADEIVEITVLLDEENIRYQVQPLLYRSWLSFNQKYSLKDQIEQLRYVSNQNQWKVLSKLPKEKYAEAIESFWRANDPTPGTIRNENRDLFYQRVMEADERFTIHKRLAGWKSDRGRIWIKFGEPDQIISDVFPMGKAPQIVWHYFKLNRSFVFKDEKGFGQYKLDNKDEEYNNY